MDTGWRRCVRTLCFVAHEAVPASAHTDRRAFSLLQTRAHRCHADACLCLVRVCYWAALAAGRAGSQPRHAIGRRHRVGFHAPAAPLAIRPGPAAAGTDAARAPLSIGYGDLMRRGGAESAGRLAAGGPARPRRAIAG